MRSQVSISKSLFGNIAAFCTKTSEFSSENVSLRAVLKKGERRDSSERNMAKPP